MQALLAGLVRKKHCAAFCVLLADGRREGLFPVWDPGDGVHEFVCALEREMGLPVGFGANVRVLDLRTERDARRSSWAMRPHDNLQEEGAILIRGIVRP
jgi:hypothetical protein